MNPDFEVMEGLVLPDLPDTEDPADLEGFDPLPDIPVFTGEVPVDVGDLGGIREDPVGLDGERNLRRYASGLTEAHRRSARQIVALGCALELRHPDRVHYTQGPGRWSAINQRRRIVQGHGLKQGDCSSTATWLIWNGITHALRTYGVADVVNGQNWRAGYTGTGAVHGVRVDGTGILGDLVYYGAGWPYGHVAVCLGNGLVFSHGGEAGPFKLRIDYRGDRAQVRRYI